MCRQDPSFLEFDTGALQTSGENTNWLTSKSLSYVWKVK